MKKEKIISSIVDDLMDNKMVAQIYIPELTLRLEWLYMAAFEAGIKSSHSTTNNPVVQLELWGGIVEVYESIKEASLSTGIPKTHISQCVNGKAEEAGGYKWRYSKNKTKDEKNGSRGIKACV